MPSTAIGTEREDAIVNAPQRSADSAPEEMSAVDRLAALTGIEDSLLDVFGTERQTTPELKRALLSAMRFDVDTEGHAEEALAALEARTWGRALPPVVVAYTTKGAISVPLVLPVGTGEVHWTLRLEDGAERTGTVDAEALPLLERHEEGNLPLERRVLTIADSLPWGYHRLTAEGLAGETTLIVTPGKCWLPSEEGKGRIWGIAANLFLLRSARNWGIGDFTDLRELIRLAKAHGADMVGLNPLHAMFLDQPEDASPYSPSDRTLLNALYIDVEAIPEFALSEETQALIASDDFRSKLEAARQAALVQYEAVTDLKLQALRSLFQTFESRRDPERFREFEAFHEERRTLLDRACVFQAMRDYFSSQNPPKRDRAEWPEGHRSSKAASVETFSKTYAELVRFHLWVQWIADTQLKEAAAAAEGMAVGLYRDVAVGAHPSGAELWSHPDELVSGAQIGAPPDLLSPAGQNWGLPPLHPVALQEHAYSSFITLLRANMRYAGGLRIDHAMALQRLYWVPKGNDARHGAYVRYPTEDLVGILALESQRHHCLVVGEDLGTVPEGFRDRMAEANILSHRVLFFEKEEVNFIPPQQYPHLALSVASNHDLPTLRGWLGGSDIRLKERLQLFPDGPEATRAERERDRAALTALLQEETLLGESDQPGSAEFSRAVHAFLARTNSLLTLVTLDDLTGEEDQVNLPGTSSENPNWRRRLSLTLEELAEGQGFAEVAGLFSAEGSSRI